MRTIWKFPIKLDVRPRLRMPRGAKVLTVQAQGSSICLWAEVDDQEPLETRQFAVYGTGTELPALWAGYRDVYIGTVQQDGFVWHLYE